jgi:hypothetical protein
MSSNSNSSDSKTCQICNQSFNSDRALQEHQNSEHSGNEQGGPRPQNERVYGDPPEQDLVREDEKQKRIA